ncbi:MAG: spermine synthase [Deltaproteobacteria bacterium]
MVNNFILAVLVVGLGGLVAQVLLLRELLVSFYGNELVIGVILANWMAAEALGAFLSGKYADKIKNKFAAFVILLSVFSAMLPVSIYLSRAFKAALGVPAGELIGLSLIFYASLLIVFPVSFCHGALFSLSCKIGNSMGAVYAWETIGTLIGGAVLTYALIPLFNSFQIAVLIAISSLAGCLLLLKKQPGPLKYAIAVIIFIFAYAGLSGHLKQLQDFSINRQWKGQAVVDYRNSVYGNIVVTQRENQYTFFYNGIPAVTVPDPDLVFVQEFGNLPLLFHPRPEDVLIVNGGAGGLINEILNYPVKRLDYAELDPLIIRMLKEHPTGLTRREFADPRLNVANRDGRFFLRMTENRYDLILIGSSNPAELSGNRLLTQDFFALAKKKLKPQGILGFYLPGSLTYLSSELKDLNACILNGLKKNYGYVRIIPGDYNIVMASDSREIKDLGPTEIFERKRLRNIKAEILTPVYLGYRLDPKWLDWFEASMADATSRINRDSAPFAVFQALVLWNKQFSLPLAHFFEFFRNSDLRCAAFVIFSAAFLLFLAFRRRASYKKLSIAYSLATTGFFGMLANLVLIFSFQVYYGYVYQKIGILISVFMAGTALGSIWMTRRLPQVKNDLGLFFKLELTIILFSMLLGLALTRIIGHPDYIYASAFTALFFVPGFLVGIEFPLAGKIYLSAKSQVGTTSGVLYFSDLAGGWLAGMGAGMLFLPLLGVFGSCTLAVLLKLSSMLFLGDLLLRKR